MALTLSGTNGVVGAGFTLDASGASVTAGVGTFGSLNAPAAGLTGALPAISAASLTQIPAANIVGVCTAGFERSGGFPNTWVKLQTTTITSSTADVTFNNSITGAFDTYNTYVIVFNETRFTADDSNLYMRIFDSSGEYTSTDYSTRTLDSGGDGNHTGLSYYRMNKEPIGNNSSGSDIYEDVFGMIYMSNFKVNRRHRIHGVISFGDTSSNKRFNPFGGGINLNTATTGVKIYPQNGNIDTGKFTLYGVAQ